MHSDNFYKPLYKLTNPGGVKGEAQWSSGSTSDSGPDDPRSSLGVAHENFCVASLDKMFTHTVSRSTQPGLGSSVSKIGE